MGSFPLSHQLQSGIKAAKQLENGALAQAVWPEPATKGHSQRGLIREASRCRTW